MDTNTEITVVDMPLEKDTGGAWRFKEGNDLKSCKIGTIYLRKDFLANKSRPKMVRVTAEVVF